MPNYQPYRFWTREELYRHCVKQIEQYGCDEELHLLIHKICFTPLWNPIEQYNGCNVVQDKYHPYVPCLIHDYRWVVDKGGINTDREFRENLKRFGMGSVKSLLMFIGVRMGWLFYYKWTK